MLGMKVGGCRRRERQNKIWMDCVKNYMSIKSVNTEMTAVRVL